MFIYRKHLRRNVSTMQRLFASPSSNEMSPQGTFCLIGTWHFPALQRFQEPFIDRWKLPLCLLILVACCWQLGRPIGLIGSPAGASDPSSASCATRPIFSTRTLHVMLLAAVTNCVQSDVQMSKGITEYFPENNTPLQVFGL